MLVREMFSYTFGSTAIVSYGFVHCVSATSMMASSVLFVVLCCMAQIGHYSGVMYCKVHQMCGRCSWNFRSRRSSSVGVPCATFDMPPFAQVDNRAVDVRVYPSTSSIAKNNNDINDPDKNPFVESNGYASTAFVENVSMKEVNNNASSPSESSDSDSSAGFQSSTIYPNETSSTSVSIVVHINSSKSSLLSSFNEPRYNTPTTDNSGTSGNLSQFLQQLAEEAIQHPLDYHIFVNRSGGNNVNGGEAARNLVPGNPSPLNSTFRRELNQVQMAASNDTCASNPQPVRTSTQMRSRPESGRSHISWVTAISRGNSLEWDNYQPLFETARLPPGNRHDSPRNHSVPLKNQQHWF